MYVSALTDVHGRLQVQSTPHPTRRGGQRYIKADKHVKRDKDGVVIKEWTQHLRKSRILTVRVAPSLCYPFPTLESARACCFLLSLALRACLQSRAELC